MAITANTNLDDYVVYVPDTGWDGWGCTFFDDNGVVCPFIGSKNGVIPVRRKGDEFTGEALCAVHGHSSRFAEQLRTLVA